MAQMKEEFRSIRVSVSPVKNRLASNQSSIYTDSDYSSWYSSQEARSIKINLEVIPDETIHKLRGIAEQMISAGNSRVCVQLYVSVRKTIVDGRFEELRGIDRLQLKDINRLEWWVHKLMIRHWMHAAKICVRGLFAGERALTSQIFNGLGSNNVADDCFMNTVKDSAIRLFDFVDLISSGRRSPEKLFQILDLYQVLSDLLPEVETIFESKSGEFIRKLAVETLSAISEKARGILSEFEKTVFKEISQVPTREVSIHPMTRNVMSYIHDMVEHEQTLNQLILSIPSSLDHIRSSALDLNFSELEGTASPLVLHLIWIIVALKFNLQCKSKQYKDASLAHCFVMNNVDYTVQKIKGLRLGDDYENKLVSVAEANYQISTAKRLRILDCFKCGSF